MCYTRAMDISHAINLNFELPASFWFDLDAISIPLPF